MDVIDAEGSLSAGEVAWVRAKAGEAVRRLGATGEVRVRLVGDREMGEAHARYSGVPGTTDVLTFDLSDGAGVLDVDILACVDEARRRAGEHGHDAARETLLYVVHGVLHCLGHDDHDHEGFERMHALEDEVLAAIGVGATFRPEGGAR